MKEPLLKLPEEISISHPEIINLSNGINVYCLNAGEQEILKLEIVFKAGEWYSNKVMFASAVNELTEAGTSRKSAFQLSQDFDYYGAYIQTECTSDVASVRLFTLTRFAKETFSLLLEMLTEANFPEEEINIFAAQQIQQLRINCKKVEYQARKKFNNLLFSGGHPYGRIVEEEDYNSFHQQEMQQWFKKYYTPQNCFMIISGKMDHHTLAHLQGTFGRWDSTHSTLPPQENYTQDFHPQKIYLPVDNAVQTAIRIGCRLPNKLHPDFKPLTVLNTVLGGYFGSRLMANLREEKGYTYGIGSAVVSMVQGGFFFISTQVDRNVKDDALEQIYKELEILRNEEIVDNELQLVKNYLTGALQRSMDGPLSVSERLKSALIHGLNLEFYHDYLQVIKTVKSDVLRQMANQYLDAKKMIEITSG